MENNQSRFIEIGESGYIPLFRKSLYSQAFQDADLWKIWCWCLLRASYQEHYVSLRTGRGFTQVKLKEGQLIYGRHSAAKELHMKSSTVRNKIEKLRNMGNLDIRPDTHFSILTVCKWSTYRELMFGKRQATGQPKDNQRTHTIRVNKGNKDIKEDTSLFIYEHYAQTIKPGTKEDAIKNINKLLKTGVNKEDLISRINAYKKQLTAKPTEYLIHANNFFGEKARYKDFEPVKSNLKSAEPGCKLCLGTGFVYVEAESANAICDCRKIKHDSKQKLLAEERGVV